MKCKSCGATVDKKWKYCPNCSKKISENDKIFIIIFIVFLSYYSFFSIIKKTIPINESYIMKSLSKKYSEKFNDIDYIKSVENYSDVTCGGSSEGVGSTEYYIVYSEKNNLEFFAYYDTSDEDKIIYDTYEDFLDRRNSILEIYDFVNANFNNIEFLISYNYEKTIEITSKIHIENYLSKFDEIDIYSDDFLGDAFFEKIYVRINEDIFEFSKNNYSIIKELNDKVVNLTNKHHFLMSLSFNNDATIELNRFDGEPYVYDKFANNKAWEERFDDFILRTEY